MQFSKISYKPSQQFLLKSVTSALKDHNKIKVLNIAIVKKNKAGFYISIRIQVACTVKLKPIM